MAITLEGSAEGNATTAQITLTLPGGIAANDYVLVDRALGNANPSISTSGYTNLVSLNNSNPRLKRDRKIMGGTPDSNVVINGTGSSFSAQAAIATTWRGVDTTTPEDATATTATGGGTQPDPPAITTVTANARVVVAAAQENSDTTITEPSGYSTALVEANGAAFPASLGVAHKDIASAGSENPGAFSNWGTNNWISSSVALRPADGGGGGGDTLMPAFLH